MSSALTSAQVSDFLSRNPSVALSATEYIDMYPWSTSLASTFLPDAGIVVADASYGNVLIQPSGGVVYYSGGVSDAIAQQINNPVYTSPLTTPPGTPSAPCDPTTGDVSGFLCSVSGYAKTALTLVGVYLLIKVVE